MNLNFPTADAGVCPLLSHFKVLEKNISCGIFYKAAIFAIKGLLRHREHVVAVTKTKYSALKIDQKSS